jgi:hypothetical protein
LQYSDEVVVAFIEPLISAQARGGYDPEDAERYVARMFEWVQTACRGGDVGEDASAFDRVASDVLYDDKGVIPQRRSAVATWDGWYRSTTDGFLSRFSTVR